MITFYEDDYELDATDAAKEQRIERLLLPQPAPIHTQEEIDQIAGIYYDLAND